MEAAAFYGGRIRRECGVDGIDDIVRIERSEIGCAIWKERGLS